LVDTRRQEEAFPNVSFGAIYATMALFMAVEMMLIPSETKGDARNASVVG
jgi:hypothetical protein